MLPVSERIGTIFAFEIPAHRGPLNPDEREFARRLGTHLHDALLAYERVRQLMQQALAGHQLLASYPYPMWLLDAQRGITFENPAAVAERERGDRVAEVGQRLVLVRSAADRQLGECLLRLHQAGHGAQATVDLRPTEADPPLWLHLSLLVPGATLGAFGERPMVLATLFDPQHVSALDPFALAQMFRLTPTEAKVAVRVAEGLTAEQIGLQLHTAQSTVRTHIREVLAKLGASRTADVVRLLRQGEALWAAKRRADDLADHQPRPRSGDR
ncbi:helix-turn-helix transcriptional regulator [Ideonella livida]|uniref:Helix-turn-helix transcriptional regulator n=1 Tax=Ideonella livida TaxID=2707176 RepID=A0A7C9TMZ6_9BURK|nr:helix-turn-helix transcriptional regulator [Ideonella livida]NDY93363.1 helix-turn-helix transcriptional regulator [Ideonella livida]